MPRPASGPGTPGRPAATAAAPRSRCRSGTPWPDFRRGRRSTRHRQPELPCRSGVDPHLQVAGQLAAPDEPAERGHRLDRHLGTGPVTAVSRPDPVHRRRAAAGGHRRRHDGRIAVRRRCHAEQVRAEPPHPAGRGGHGQPNRRLDSDRDPGGGPQRHLDVRDPRRQQRGGDDGADQAGRDHAQAAGPQQPPEQLHAGRQRQQAQRSPSRARQPRRAGGSPAIRHRRAGPA